MKSLQCGSGLTAQKSGSKNSKLRSQKELKFTTKIGASVSKGGKHNLGEIIGDAAEVASQKPAGNASNQNLKTTEQGSKQFLTSRLIRKLASQGPIKQPGPLFSK